MRLNIRPYFIPSGMTDAFQTLDRTVFGVLKASAKHLSRWPVNQNRGALRTKGDAVQDLVAA
jgi:hypothetical protein